MSCLNTAWTAHERELRGWLHHRLGNVAQADDVLQDLFLKASLDTLTACLPRMLSELSPEDREAITLCDLKGMAQAEFAAAKGLSAPASA
jgi:RNA polymerase sigma-70 factor (ECF subfamily)